MRKIELLPYLGLALLILGPLLMSGYILTLDMAWTPRIPVPAWGTSSYLIRGLLYLLQFLLPSDVIQKLLLIVIFSLMGIGMHRLIAFCCRERSTVWGSYFGGVFYTINPFTYARFMDGQWNVLFGYAILPFFVLALERFLRSLGKRDGLWLIGVVVAVCIVSLHTIYILLVIGLVRMALFVVEERTYPRRIVSGLIRLSLIGGLIVVLNSYWLAPFALGKTTQARQVNSFDQRHLLTFRTEVDQQIGWPWTLLTLQGYWGEREGRFLLPKDSLPGWWMVWAVLMLLTIVGGIRAYVSNRTFMMLIILVLVIGVVLGAGIAWPTVAGLNSWLIQVLPFFEGYREPHKFAALIGLALAWLGGVGIGALPKKLPGYMMLILPFLFTPTFIWGGAGQLKTHDYPPDWYEANEWLTVLPDTSRVLFLPWHQYMYFGFAQRTMANPAAHFFEQPTMMRERAEIGLLQGLPVSADEHFIENTLFNVDLTAPSIGSRLSKLQIHYIVLAKEVNWENYDFLNQQPDLELVSDTATLRIYENLAFVR